MVYGYARCSTNETRQDIDRQKRDLKHMGAMELYCEYESGVKMEKPELNKLLRIIAPGDTLIATEISRITRSTRQLCEIVEFAQERKIKLVIGDLVIDCVGGLDAMTEGMLKMMGVFAEIERKLTIERINSGIANARAKGVRLGRPAFKFEDIPKKVLEHYETYTNGQLNKTDYARLCGISRNTLYRYLSLLQERA